MSDNEKQMSDEELRREIKKKDKKITKEKIKGFLKNITIIILIIIVLILLALKSCNNSRQGETQKLEIETAEYYEQTESKAINKDVTDIPVLNNNVKISKSKPYVNVYNPETNSTFLKYEFTEGESVVFESKLVQPGYKFSVDLGNLLDVGEHSVNVKITVYSNTGEKQNGTAQNIKVTVIE